jgi:hypothetical protein
MVHLSTLWWVKTLLLHIVQGLGGLAVVAIVVDDYGMFWSKFTSPIIVCIVMILDYFHKHNRCCYQSQSLMTVGVPKGHAYGFGFPGEG